MRAPCESEERQGMGIEAVAQYPPNVLKQKKVFRQLQNQAVRIVRLECASKRLLVRRRAEARISRLSERRKDGRSIADAYEQKALHGTVNPPPEARVFRL